MATADQYAAWIVANKDKKDTPEFNTVAQAYKLAKDEESALQAPQPATPAAEELPAERSYYDRAAQFARNVGGGLAAGGAPIVSLAMGESPEEQRQRLQAITQVTGADPESFGYGAGEFATQTGALMGLGMGAGAAATRLGAPVLGTALQTGGLTTKIPVSQRIIGGAAMGAPAGAIMSPEDAGSGAMMGAAFGGAAGLVLPTVGRAAMGVANALSPKYSQKVVNDVYSRAFGNDLAKIEQAANLAASGATAEQIAVATQTPAFAVLVNEASRGNLAVNELAFQALTARNTALANQLEGAAGVVNPAAAQARVAAESSGSMLPEVAPSAPGQVLREAAKAEKKTMRDTVIRPAYEAAFKAAGDAPNIPVSGLVSDFEQIAGVPFARWNPSEMPSQVGMALRKFVPESVDVSFPGQIGRSTKTLPPQATLRDLDGLRSTINAERRLAQEAGDDARVRILNQMHTSIDRAVESSAASQAAKDLYADAVTTYREGFAPRFKTGEQVDVFRTVRNQPGVLPEDMITKFIQPGGEQGAKNLVAMLGDNPQGKAAAAQGLDELFRQKVTKNGAVDPQAVSKFMDDYKLPLKELEKAGIRLSPTSRTAGGAATRMGERAEMLAGQSKTIDQLKKAVDKDPTNPVAMQTLSEAETAIADVTAALKDRREFAKLVSFGSGVAEDVMGVGMKGPVKIPVGITAEIIYNNVNRFLRERVSKKLADQIGRELLDSGALSKALKDAYAAQAAAPRGPSRVPAGVVNALVGSAADSQNRLAP